MKLMLYCKHHLYIAPPPRGFHLDQYAFSTNIGKAFLHVKLDEQDREYTNFFVVIEPWQSGEPVYHIQRYK